MRLIKMLGLAAAAALAAMALGGIGSASADSLCHVKVNHETGECAAPLAVGKFILGTSIGHAVLLGANETDVIEECASHILGKLIGNDGEHKGLLVLLELFSFFSCLKQCKKAIWAKLPILFALALSLHAIIEEDAKAGTPAFLFEECSFFNFHCLYEIKKFLMDFEEDRLIAKKIELLRGSLCTFTSLFAEKGFWDATYLVTLHNTNVPLYIAPLP